MITGFSPWLGWFERFRFSLALPEDLGASAASFAIDASIGVREAAWGAHAPFQLVELRSVCGQLLRSFSGHDDAATATVRVVSFEQAQRRFAEALDGNATSLDLSELGFADLPPEISLLPPIDGASTEGRNGYRFNDQRRDVRAALGHLATAARLVQVFSPVALLSFSTGVSKQTWDDLTSHLELVDQGLTAADLETASTADGSVVTANVARQSSSGFVRNDGAIRDLQDAIRQNR